VAEARACLVDEVLEDGGVEHSQRDDPESENDAVNGREWDLCLAQSRIYKTIQDGYHDDDGERIEVLHEIVGDAVASHLIGCDGRRIWLAGILSTVQKGMVMYALLTLRNEVVRELTVAHPVDWVDAEHLAGDQSAFQLVDELVVPGY
jgi:hypothetical protein